MIKIKEYKFGKDLQDDFISFMGELYKKNEYAPHYIESIKKIINPSNPSFKFIKIKNFLAYSEDKVVGHIAAMLDSRLDSSEKNGLIGFYECIEDDTISKKLIETAEAYLMQEGCDNIRAPIDLTIWHPYRFVIDQGNESFLLEPLTKKHYSKQFENQGYTIAVEYGSAERSDFNTIMDYTKRDWENTISEGFKIRTLSSDNYEEGIFSIYEMSKNIFKDSWSYVEISKEEYSYIYNDYAKNIDNLIIQIISDKNGNDIGFCSSIIDSKKNFIILKTIGILPKYQNKRVGAALLYEQHKIATERKLSKEIYALIKLGNIVTKLPYHGFKVIRKYVALEKNLFN